MIEIAAQSLGYPGRTVLSGVELAVEPGEVLAVVGPNGVGKSTLLRAVAGTLPVVQGRIRVGDRDVADLIPAERARLLAVVPQATGLPPWFRALDVVLMGRTPYLGWLEREDLGDLEIAEDAMRRTDTWDLSQRPVGELSGGEAQRVLIARALAQSTPAMLLDEPTAHLDLRHQDAVLTLIRDLALEDRIAVLMALHDLNLVARYADRAALLSDGTIHSVGSPETVLNPDDLAAVYGVRIHVADHPVDGSPLVLTG